MRAACLAIALAAAPADAARRRPAVNNHEAVACVGGSFTPFCSSEVISIDLVSKPVPNDLHRTQLRNGAGPLSNELPVCVGSASGCM